MYRTLKFICVMLASVLVGAEQARSADRAVIQVRGEAEPEVMWFRENAVLFADRNHRVNDCPDWLEGERFLKSAIDTTHIDVVQSGRIMVLTPHPISGADSQSSRLEDYGFTQLEHTPFQLFGDREINQVRVYEKEAAAGESFQFEKWVVVLGFERARSSMRDRTRAAEDKPFYVFPEDIPNTGLLFVDREKLNASGHGNNSIAECQNGDILSFYSMTGGDGENIGGHGPGGVTHYRRSTDGGVSWGEPVELDYSREMWEGDEVFSALVYSVVTAPNGTLVATVIRYSGMRWTKQLPPVYLLSDDHGHTWNGPHEFDPAATVEDISFTMNTAFVHDGDIYIVFRGGTSDMSPGGPQTLWVSEDNGQSFSQRSVLPFEDASYYWAANVLDNGDIIVYTYNAHVHRDDPTAEKNIPYVISTDKGHTWSPIKTTYLAKAIRNPQMSGKLGDLYFLHGRSGSFDRDLIGDDAGTRNLVLYSSKDGINWDEGILLMSRDQHPGGADCYSVNAIVGKYRDDTPERLLIQSSISYDGRRVNSHQWWVSKTREALDGLGTANSR